MEYKTMGMTIENHLATIKINNPPVNSITPQMVDELSNAFTEIEKESDVRAVILASALDKVFIAGADINQLLGWKGPDAMSICSKGHEALLKIANFHKPVICVINGIAFGGGLEIALACDIRVIDKKAKVALPECGLGIIPGFGGTVRLPKLVGAGMAKKLTFGTEPIGGEEAYRIGLAEILSEQGECFNDAFRLADSICKRAPKAVTAAKRSIDFNLSNSVEYGIAFEIEQIGMLADTQDKTEGAQAFFEKRLPNFINE